MCYCLAELSGMGDEVVLSYKDVVLKKSDLELLEGPYYLNDQIIGLYFSYLSSLLDSQDILLVPPSVSFWLANCSDPESVKDFAEPLKFSCKNLVVLL
ncbi:NEDD8-specific protease 1-like [Malania oleifera]|uniref:NEDD8-specific protease 1-like n=1 Tax=Malania oleifera TaxID=397392 RepID=UPI0025AEAF64|nr:NEDD8-specific protease 1-like [Malania oleifera]